MPLVLVAAPIAAMAALMLYVWWATTNTIWVPALARILGQIPLISNQLNQWLYRGAAVVVGWAHDQAVAGLDALIQLIAVPVTWLGHAVDEVGNTITGVVSALVMLADRIGQLSAWASGMLTMVDLEIRSAVGSIDRARSSAIATSVAIARQLVGDAESGLHLAIASTTAALTSAIAAEHALVVATKGDLLGIIAGQADVASRALASAVATLRHDWATDLRPISADLAGVKGVTDAITAGGIITMAITTAATLAKVTEECINPTCEAIGPQVDAINALLSGVELAVLAGIVAEAIRDPRSAASGTAAVIDGIHRDVSSVAGAVLGIAI